VIFAINGIWTWLDLYLIIAGSLLRTTFGKGRVDIACPEIKAVHDPDDKRGRRMSI